MKNNNVEIKYMLADGTIIELSVSCDIAKVLKEERKMKKRHAMQKVRRGSNKDFETLLMVNNCGAFSHAGRPIEEDVEQNELANLIRGLLEKLTETQQRRLIMRFYHEMALNEIAEAEKVEFQSIADSIEQALQRLKKELLEKNIFENYLKNT